jgi:hypothetical protein
VFHNFVTNITAELYARHTADIGRDLELPVILILPAVSIFIQEALWQYVQCRSFDGRRHTQTFSASLQDLAHTRFTIDMVSNKRLNLISCRLMAHVLKATRQTNKASEHRSE